jgi:hypothetical protein
MSSKLDQLTADAMKLRLRDRVQLAQRLVSTIDDEVDSDTEALWSTTSCGLVLIPIRRISLFGNPYLQIMPRSAFQDMTDHDLRAIYEYLSAIPCIEGDPGLPNPRPIGTRCH